MSTRLRTENYMNQKQTIWPRTGRHILAQYDSEGIVVYQAFCPQIAAFAVKNGKFGGPGYSFQRMTWIKTNFMWMMYRSGWAGKRDQERILAIRLSLEGFDTILANARRGTRRDKGQIDGHRTADDVRLQWDPDHSPAGGNLERRAIQLGIRGKILESFNEHWILGIEDITDFVRLQYQLVLGKRIDDLMSPSERVYTPSDPDIARHIGIDDPNCDLLQHNTATMCTDENDQTILDCQCSSDDMNSLIPEVTDSETLEVNDVKCETIATPNNGSDVKCETIATPNNGSDINCETSVTPKEQKRQKLVIALGGAFNPVHTRHVLAMVEAKTWIETNTNYDVIAGRLAVSTDGYVKAKAKRKNYKCIKGQDRINLCELACDAHKDWLMPYSKTIGSAGDCVKKTKAEIESACDFQNVKMAVIIGADRAINFSGIPKWRRTYDYVTICIGRDGETDKIKTRFEEDKVTGKVVNDNFFFVPSVLDDVSSTKIRLRLREMDDIENFDDKVKVTATLVDKGWIGEKEADYIVKHFKDIYISS